MIFDPNDSAGAHALERLANDRIGWLTTVSPAGQPMSMPIWYHWQDGELVIYSDGAAGRNVNVAAHPKVASHLGSKAGGGDIVIVHSGARIDLGYTQVPDNAEYLAKYGDWIDAHLGGPTRMAAIF